MSDIKEEDRNIETGQNLKSNMSDSEEEDRKQQSLKGDGTKYEIDFKNHHITAYDSEEEYRKQQRLNKDRTKYENDFKNHHITALATLAAAKTHTKRDMNAELQCITDTLKARAEDIFNTRESNRDIEEYWKRQSKEHDETEEEERKRYSKQPKQSNETNK